MKILIIMIVLVLIAGAAYYRGWFNVSSGDKDGKTNVILSVDKNQIEADKDKVVDKVQDTVR